MKIRRVTLVAISLMMLITIFKVTVGVIPIQALFFHMLVLLLIGSEEFTRPNTPFSFVWVGLYFIGYIFEALTLPRGLIHMDQSWMGASPILNGWGLSEVFSKAILSLILSYLAIRVFDFAVGKIEFSTLSKRIEGIFNLSVVLSLLILGVLYMHDAAKVGTWNQAKPIFGIPKLLPLLVMIADCLLPSTLISCAILLGIDNKLKKQHLFLIALVFLVSSLTRNSRGDFIIKMSWFAVFYLFYTEPFRRISSRKQIILGVLTILGTLFTVFVGNALRNISTGGATGAFSFSDLLHFVAGRLGVLDLGVRIVQARVLNYWETLALMNPLGLFFPTYESAYDRLVGYSYVIEGDFSFGFSMYVPLLLQESADIFWVAVTISGVLGLVGLLIRVFRNPFHKLVLIIQFFIIFWFWYNQMMVFSNMHGLVFLSTAFYFGIVQSLSGLRESRSSENFIYQS